ncbi:MAG TPA: aminoacyl-tRNA hydrolase [Firmicutes bacterium]|nr:aminoacyl-tRNA hydrolase [Bacillota bacterium]
MFCITGLGNPGPQYQETRHNAGFLTIDKLAQRAGIQLNKKGFQSLYGKGTIDDQDSFLIKPQTFMNLSGQAVSSLVAYYKIPVSKLLIIYDDLDLPLGKIRFRLSGSPGGHKGLTSIIQMLGTNEVPRLRVGIGRPKNDQAVVDYVLAPFSGEEKRLFLESIEQAAIAGSFFVTEGPQYVMNHFN